MATSDRTSPRETVQLLDEHGVRTPSPEWDRWIEDLDDATLADRYEDMVVLRRIDAEATALQRQGEIALWPPVLGQEAAQIGSGRALRADDFVFGSYRETGVAYTRGIDPDRHRAGLARRGRLGLEPLRRRHGHLAGHHRRADACTRPDTPSASRATVCWMTMRPTRVAVAYFGDGAMSEGDVSEAMIFAATYQAPVVFFCQNNQFAISEPVTLQSTRAARRPPGRLRHPVGAGRRQRPARRDRGHARGARPRAHRRRAALHRGGHLPHGPAHHRRRPDPLPRPGRARGLGAARSDRCGCARCSSSAARPVPSSRPASRRPPTASLASCAPDVQDDDRPRSDDGLRQRVRRAACRARPPARRLRALPGRVRTQ